MTWISELAPALIERYGSPLYVYNADVIEAAYTRFRAAFSYQPTELHYAIVCNKNPFIVRMLHALGAGVHANTPGDAFAAIRAGVPASRILYSGTNLNAGDLEWLDAHGIEMNLDSLHQLRDAIARTRRTSFGLRMLIDVERSGNRIGVTLDELSTAVQVTQAAGKRLAGLHMYAGTNTLRASRFLQCFDRLLQGAELLPDLEYLDVGGGFGVRYEDEDALALEELGAEITARMQQLSERRGREVRLYVEPGRLLVAEGGCLLMTVVSVKERAGRRFVGVDSTVGNIVVESVYHVRHRIEAMSAAGPPLPMPTDVCGNTTHSRDFIARSCRLPHVDAGDVLALRDVGAYGYAMSSHFLNRPRPAEVVVSRGDVHLTTRRETFDDLVATQIANA